MANHRSPGAVVDAERAAAPPTAPATDTRPSTARTPYGLPLAPIRRERPSAPCDLGDYGAEELRGWIVIFSRDVEFAVYRDLSAMLRASREASEAGFESALDVINDVVAWLESILLAWNFVDRDGRPLPQPRDGGAAHCPFEAFPAIARAFGQSTTPPKDSGTPSIAR